MLKIALIGSTGSIGRQVLSVVRRYNDRYSISALVTGSNRAELLAEAKEFSPEVAVLAATGEAYYKKDGFTVAKTDEQAALRTIEGADVVFVAATGFAGLKYSLKAIECKKRLALANKETLVCGGEYATKKARENGVDVIPVDSEHSALWQALAFNKNADFEKLIITASGGPFYGYSPEQLKAVTVEKALCHPTWKMGPKITIDSATLLNKGFEVIEAKWLYNAKWEQIETVVQPTSIIHSMVGFKDGAVLAQLSYPTMEVPIQLALTYPDRLPTELKLPDFAALGSISFKPLIRKDFPCYDLALTAGEMGDNYPCALNGAGEVAVHAFLNKRIPFTGISEVIARTLEKTERVSINDYNDLATVDGLSRAVAESVVKDIQW